MLETSFVQLLVSDRNAYKRNKPCFCIILEESRVLFYLALLTAELQLYWQAPQIRKKITFPSPGKITFIPSSQQKVKRCICIETRFVLLAGVSTWLLTLHIGT